MPPSIASRMRRMLASSLSFFLLPMWAPPRPIIDTSSPVLPSWRLGTPADCAVGAPASDDSAAAPVRAGAGEAEADAGAVTLCLRSDVVLSARWQAAATKPAKERRPN